MSDSALTPRARVYVAGHRGLVGSALMRRLQRAGYSDLITRTHAELDLTDAGATAAFFEETKPEYVFLAAARVGGIVANNTYPADFIGENLAIQSSVVRAAFKTSTRRMMFLGSSCIYPRLAPQPIPEASLLTGPLEPTNRPYALAKIAGIELCWSYNRQHGTRYLAAMPTNLYGPGDNYHPTNSHVIPALIRKFHEARYAAAPAVTVWGTGTPRREFLHSDDMADACVFLMELPDERFDSLLGSDESISGCFDPPVVNIGVGQDIAIAELAALVKKVVGYEGDVIYDRSKPDGTPRKLLDVSRLRRVGWQARIGLEEGLRSVYEQFLKQSREASPQ